jgi:hypothetical protein
MKSFIYLLLLLPLPCLTKAQVPEANFDESKVPGYTLPDALIFKDGSKVRTKSDWDKRRSEIYKLFENEVYGKSPVWNGKVEVSTISQKEDDMGGLATRKEIKLRLMNGNRSLDINILLFLPNAVKPAPIFIGYNFDGNQATIKDPEITITSSWVESNIKLGVINNKATEASRGADASNWPVKEIISRGYGLATINYNDVDPDFDDGFKNGVPSLFTQQRDSSSWANISAWAWGLSRVMDYIEKVPEIDRKKVIVIGHSRLGKTALWAAASDQRFAIAISNMSGCAGAALSRRIFGETVEIMNRNLSWWTCDNFKKYNGKEETLPVDQHELLALIAPRPVYVASAKEDFWADPKGEFLSCVAASPVYELLGLKRFPAVAMPPVDHPVMGSIGYHIRTGAHDITLYDWERYMDFADLHFKKNKTNHR